MIAPSMALMAARCATRLRRRSWNAMPMSSYFVRGEPSSWHRGGMWYGGVILLLQNGLLSPRASRSRRICWNCLTP